MEGNVLAIFSCHRSFTLPLEISGRFVKTMCIVRSWPYLNKMNWIELNWSKCYQILCAGLVFHLYIKWFEAPIPVYLPELLSPCRNRTPKLLSLTSQLFLLALGDAYLLRDRRRLDEHVACSGMSCRRASSMCLWGMALWQGKGAGLRNGAVFETLSWRLLGEGSKTLTLQPFCSLLFSLTLPLAAFHFN